MKKVISILLIILSAVSMFSVNTFAKDILAEQTLIIKDDIIEEVYGLYNTDNNTGQNIRATGLITSKSLKLSKTSDKLVITAKTSCASDVEKCGFTYIKLQRLINGTWTDYTTYCYYDQYAESTTKTFSKSISAPTGYTYRAICEHYAEKTKLLILKDKETSYNETSSLAF